LSNDAFDFMIPKKPQEQSIIDEIEQVVVGNT
jgi:hypothetical protein